jgi:hypothetical protein
MDRHNISTYLQESFHCTHIKDYYLKESIFDKNNDLFLTGRSVRCLSKFYFHFADAQFGLKYSLNQKVEENYAPRVQ